MPRETILPHIYKANGAHEEVQPANGSYFTLEELQTLIGGYVEFIHFDNDLVMVVDEDGALKHLPRNEKATWIAKANGKIEMFTNYEVVGNALVCLKRMIR